MRSHAVELIPKHTSLVNTIQHPMQKIVKNIKIMLACVCPIVYIISVVVDEIISPHQGEWIETMRKRKQRKDETMKFDAQYNVRAWKDNDANSLVSEFFAKQTEAQERRETLVRHGYFAWVQDTSTGKNVTRFN